MQKKTIIRILLSILIFVIFIIIFVFSNQDGSKSKSVSEKFMRGIVDIYPKTSKLNNEDKEKIVQKSQPFIRKTAHFTVYMIAGFLIMSFLCTYDLKLNKKIIFTFTLGLIYAISDEIHQGFIGRR